MNPLLKLKGKLRITKRTKKPRRRTSDELSLTSAMINNFTLNLINYIRY